MAFKFRLEKVAHYRQKLVDEQGRRVAEANRTVVGLEARIVALDEDLSQHLKEFSDVNDAVISVQGMMARTMWVTHLDDVRAEFARDLLAAQEELAQQRTLLNEVWRDLEVLNKLREKQKAAWLADEIKRENQDLDEIGQIRADRQRRSKVAS